MIRRQMSGMGGELTDAAKQLLSNVGGKVSASAQKLDVGLTIAAYASVVAAVASVIGALGSWRRR